MLLSAVVTLLSSQLQVYVASGVSADAIRASELCAKTKCLDGTAVHDRFFPRSSLLPGWDFDGFTAGPMDGWPKPLDEKWRSTTAKCRAIAGPPPWKSSEQSAALACGERASTELWAAWLAHQKATQVAVFETTRSGKGELLVVHAYAFPASEARVSEASLSESSLAQALKVLAPRALKLEGLPEKFVLSATEDAKAGVAGAFAGEAVVSTPVTGVKACDSAPSLLEVSGSDPLAKSVSTRWSASKIGKAPGRSCTLSETMRDERGIVQVTVVTATLSCGEVSVAGELATAAKNPVDVLSAKLVKQLATRLCR
ncbi:MAG: hypothetical protein DI536_29495 [Archangium gephyra]|uniref:Uncharacterized protein n=1 Tax=Archangium gephyra TaxID=48 RepID=A0A2W5UTN9_9BACT|nr:MAG: hypothetical protein DI536_29495 [Archangium gephyra]